MHGKLFAMIVLSCELQHDRHFPQFSTFQGKVSLIFFFFGFSFSSQSASDRSSVSINLNFFQNKYKNAFPVINV